MTLECDEKGPGRRTIRLTGTLTAMCILAGVFFALLACWKELRSEVEISIEDYAASAIQRHDSSTRELILDSQNSRAVIPGPSLDHVRSRTKMIRAFTICNLVLSASCFASFAWAIKSLFRRSNGLPAPLITLTVLGSLFFAGQLASIIVAKPPFWSSCMGTILFLASLCLFWWAVPFASDGGMHVAFGFVIPGTLVTSGPYHFVRHPFYLSYLLFWTAGVFAAFSSVLLLSVVVTGGFYLKAINREEAEMLAGPCATNYREYCRLTGALLPRLSWNPKSAGSPYAETEK